MKIINTVFKPKNLLPLMGVLALIYISNAQAAPVPGPLSSLTVPEPSNLNNFVKSKPWAIRLGKALFWDMQVGSDGTQACASCHFNAFADNRIKNQVNPGGAHSGDTLFGWRNVSNCDRSPEDIGPNYTLKPDDFPLRRTFGGPRAKKCDTDDVVSSQGVVGADFISILRKGDVDKANPGIDGDGLDPDGFVKDGILVRRVEPRNTPTVINSVFYMRQFWDGRAMPNFNGINPDGSVDVNNPFVVESIGRGRGKLEKREISIDNASLASQAVGPPLSLFEMSANHRRFPDLGSKMLHKRPLAKQKVNKRDSVLGSLAARGNRPGLKDFYTYDFMVKKAFRNKWWKGHRRQKVCVAKVGSDVEPQVALSTAYGACPDWSNYDKFTQKEYNFSLFWGLAIQLYEATLISGDTPFDKCAALDDPFACLGQQNPDWEEGLRVFMNDPVATTAGKGNCVTCHRGPMFSGATFNEFNKLGTFGEIPTLTNTVGIYDLGFANIGQSDTPWDLGVGGTFADGITLLSFSQNAKNGNTALGSIPIGKVVCDENAPAGCSTSDGPDDFDLVMSPGAFKTPGLRNRKWMGPHFHNGDAANITGLLGFYNANGNDNETKDSRLEDIDLGGFGQNATGAIPAVAAFLNEALADPNVEFQKAPFDHPELCVPHGHDDSTGETIFRHIGAVGKKGSSKPLVTFDEMLEQDLTVLAGRENSLLDPCPEYMLPQEARKSDASLSLLDYLRHIGFLGPAF